LIQQESLLPLKTAKTKGADIVLVFYHMGVENVTEPTQAQKDAVRFALEAGASIGNWSTSSHVGPTQKLYSKSAINDTVFVAYSLGNFLSNQYWRYTDAGVILKIDYTEKLHQKNISFKEASFTFQLGFIEAMEVEKCMFYFLLNGLRFVPNCQVFIRKSHQQKMLEAFNDTRLILTKYNSELKLNSVK
jgi:hypothetical protein